MSQSIDKRVVEMQFDNKQFESGVKESLGTLDKLKNILDKGISSKSIDDIGKAAKNTDMSGLVSGVQALSDRFSTLGIVGMRVIENITDGLMNGLTKGIHAATDAIISGGIKRAMNIENAHFQLQGLINDEREVQAVMDNAMDSVDGTAYAYDEAAKAASMFAASGLKSGEQMETALRGIAGVAATTNQEYQRVADVFTKIAGKGKIQGDELNQFASMGMNAAAAMTKYFNEVNDGTIEVDENFKKLVTDLTDGLEITEADLRDLVSGGQVSFELFSRAMGDSFGEHAKDANKTFTGSMANIRAALARTGAMFISPLVKQDGPFVQFFNAIRIKVNEFNKALGATNGIAERFTTWVNNIVTKMTGVIENFKVANTWVQKFGDGTTKTFADAHHTIQKFGDGTQKVIAGDVYTPFQAFSDTIQIIVNSFKALKQIISPIGAAFKETFSFDPTGIYKTLESIKEATGSFKLSENGVKDLHDAFKGLFDVISLVFEIGMKLIKTVFKGLDTASDETSFNILQLAGSIGRALTSFTEFIRNSESFRTIFDKIGDIISKAKENFTDFISSIKNGIHIDLSGITRLKEGMTGLAGAATVAKNVLSTVWDGIKAILAPLGTAMENLGQSILKLLGNLNPLKALLSLINAVLFTDLIANLRNISDTFTKTAKAPLNFINKMKSTLSELQNSLKAMTMAINAGAIKDIAIAVGILAASMFVLSSIDAVALAKALGAVTASIYELVGAITIMGKLFSSTTFKGSIMGMIDSVRIGALGTTLIKLAAAVLILSFAMKNLADLNLEQIIKGLGAMAYMMLELVGAVALLDKVGGSKKIASAGLGMILIAAAVNLMVKAMEKLSGLSWEEIGNGLAAIGGILLEMSLFTKIAGGTENMLSISLGMILVAAAVNVMAKAVMQLSGMSWDEIGRGLATVGGLLLELALFTKISGGSTNMIAISVGMVILTQALKMLAEVMQTIAGLSWEEIAKGLIAIGYALTEMTLALILMPNTAILKAAGVVVLAFAMKTLGEVIQSLGGMSWETIAKGLLAMGYALTEVGIALNAIPPWAILGAAGLLVTAIALKSIAEAMQQFGGMSWEAIAKGLLAMGYALTEVVAAMMFATYGLVGAAAILVVALALKMILPLFIELGNMEWESIGKACVAMGAAFAILIAAMAGIGAISELALPGALALLAFGVALGVSIAVVSEAIDILVGTINSMEKIDPQTFLTTTTTVALGIAELGLALKTFGITSPIGASALKTVAQGLQILAPAIMVFSVIDGKTLAKTFVSLASGIATFGLSLKTFGPLSNIGANAFNTIATAISKLAPAMTIFIKLDLTKVAVSLKVLANSFSDFGPALKSFGLLAGVGANAMNIVADAINKLAPAMVIFTSLDPDRLSSALGTLGGAFKLFGEALDATPFWGSGMRANGIGALIDNIGKLTEALPPFMALSADQVKTALTTLGDGFKLFGEALTATPFWAGTSRADGIGALIDTIPKLTETLPPFMDMMSSNGSRVATALQTLGTGFKNFGEAVNAAPLFNPEDRATAIVDIVNAISTLTTGLSNFMQLDSNGVNSAFDSLAIGFSNFGTAISTAPLFNADERATAMVDIVNSIDTLAEGVTKLAGLDTGTTTSVLEAIGTAFESFGTALKKTPFWNADERAGGMISLVNSVDILADAIVKLTAIPYNDLVNVVGVLKYSIEKLGEVLNNYGTFVTANAGVITTIAEAANGLGSINTNTLSAAITQIERLIQVFTTMNGIDVSQASAFAIGLKQLATNGLIEFSNAFSGDAGSNVLQIVREWLNRIIQALKEKESNFKNAGLAHVKQYLTAIKNQYKEASNTGKGLGQKVYEGVYEYAKKFKDVGKYCIQGFIDGLSDSELMKEVRRAAKKMAEEAKKAAEAALNEHSPSKEFYKIGSFATLGFINGLYAFGSAVSTAGSDLANTATAGLNKALEGLQDGVDNMLETDPVITPMVDLTNVLSAADQINSLFNSALLSTSASAGNISRSLAMAQANKSVDNNQNEDKMYGNTYNFTQNNTSPKALSRIEIYRDSRNLFREFREAVEGV